METLVKIENLNMKYPVKTAFGGSGKTFINAVNDVSLEIKKSEILGLVGESGCGKSTLGRCTLLLEKCFTGKIFFNGVDITTLKDVNSFRKSAQMVFQNPYASLNPRMTIYDILKEPLLVHGIKAKKIINVLSKDVSHLEIRLNTMYEIQRMERELDEKIGVKKDIPRNRRTII